MPTTDKKLTQKAEDLQRLVEEADQDGKEAAKKFDELKQLMMQEGMKLAMVTLSGEQQLTLQRQREELLKKLASSPYVKGLQQKFLTAVFPMGGSIINVAYNLYNAKPPIMTDKQRDELAQIGKRMVDLPYKMLSGEYDLKKGYHEVISAIKSLTDFVSNKNNLNIAINAGATFLDSIHPLGAFFKVAVRELLQSDLPKNMQEGALRAMSIMVKHYDKLETVLQNAAELKLDEVKHRGDSVGGG